MQRQEASQKYTDFFLLMNSLIFCSFNFLANVVANSYVTWGLRGRSDHRSLANCVQCGNWLGWTLVKRLLWVPYCMMAAPYSDDMDLQRSAHS